MKNGKVYIGPLWTFRPAEGWMQIICDDAPEQIHFRDVESAVTKNDRINVNKIGDVDELERARQNGWNGT